MRFDDFAEFEPEAEPAASHQRFLHSIFVCCHRKKKLGVVLTSLENSGHELSVHVHGNYHASYTPLVLMMFEVRPCCCWYPRTPGAALSTSWLVDPGVCKVLRINGYRSQGWRRWKRRGWVWKCSRCGDFCGPKVVSVRSMIVREDTAVYCKYGHPAFRASSPLSPPLLSNPLPGGRRGGGYPTTLDTKKPLHYKLNIDLKTSSINMWPQYNIAS